ncbi:MAG: YraN family protein [Planctomycetes bacterium]|nr:YraN family protein [Planctomycetota bacterium]
MLQLWVSRKKLLAEPKLLGRWGERKCERFLRRKGMKTVVRNFSCNAGEIDLVMSDAHSGLVFVEVKSRADEKFSAAEASITPDKRAKLIRTARYFVQTHDVENIPMRFDVVIVILGDRGRGRIRHYENAFVP